MFPARQKGLLTVRIPGERERESVRVLLRVSWGACICVAEGRLLVGEHVRVRACACVRAPLSLAVCAYVRRSEVTWHPRCRERQCVIERQIYMYKERERKKASTHIHIYIVREGTVQ